MLIVGILGGLVVLMLLICIALGIRHCLKKKDVEPQPHKEKLLGVSCSTGTGTETEPPLKKDAAIGGGISSDTNSNNEVE